MYFTSQPLWLSALVLVGLTTLSSMIGPIIVRRFVSLDGLTTNNEVAGFKFATIGVLYAVLLAFATILVWEKYSDAEATVAREAGAMATLYHLSDGMGDAKAEFRASLNGYLKAVISDEWPAMNRGGGSRPATEALHGIYKAALKLPLTANNTALMSAIFYQLDVVTQARRARLVAAEGSVPGVVWAILFGGAIITITFTLFFGTRNLRAQTLMTGLLALLIFSELLIIVVIDRPFTGTVKVGPDALSDLLQDFGS